MLKNKFYLQSIVCAMLVITATSAFSQEKGKIRGGMDVGINGFYNHNIDFQIGYNLLNNMNVGFKFSFGNKPYSYGSDRSYLGTCSYYFSSGKNSFAPFIGGGIGSYIVSIYWDNFDDKFGGFLTTGFEAKKFRMAFEYNLVPKSTGELKFNHDNYYYVVRNSYGSVTIGFYIGGGQWNRINRLSGFTDKKGDLSIPPNYNYALEFSEGLAGLKVKKKWGFVDERIKEVIPFKYDEVGVFSEGLARVKLKGKWGIIDKIGRLVTPIKYNEIGEFSEELARVKLNGRWGFIDKTGKEVISAKYDDVGQFSEGLARVNLSNKWGFLDKTGRLVIPLKYDNAGDFSEGVAQIKLMNSWGNVDATGKELFPNVPTVNPNENKPNVTLSVPPSEITQDIVIQHNDNEIKNESQRTNTDIITLRNGDEIKARVTEISPTEIKYKRFDNLEGPTIIIPKAEIFAINYGNGTRDVINPVNASGGTRTQTQAGMSTPYQQKKAAFGVNGLMGCGAGFDYENGFLDYGVGANFSYIVGGGVRLAGDFDILWGKSSMDLLGIEVAIKTRWTDFGMYVHYLIPAGEGVVYPLLGVGMANLAVTAGALGHEETEKDNYFTLSFGSGLGYPISRDKNLVLNLEVRGKYMFKENAFRFHLAPGLAYRF